MQSMVQTKTAIDGAEIVTLNWESLGILVRRRTLELIAMHFACVASSSTAGADPSVPDDAGCE